MKTFTYQSLCLIFKVTIYTRDSVLFHEAKKKIISKFEEMEKNEILFNYWQRAYIVPMTQRYSKRVPISKDGERIEYITIQTVEYVIQGLELEALKNV